MEYEFVVEINPNDKLFLGHFPGKPVLPGVCTIQIVKECICSVLGRDLHFMNISQCKFMGMVDPQVDNRLTINISYKNDNAIETVNASVNNSGRVVSKIKATLL
ncbi:MAG: beta-hydroxyacyl-ACP dehydratase [Bacteroidales bacterium]|jgi:3-hydroxyacyl-[acyl-carrier-protein] dehydratase